MKVDKKLLERGWLHAHEEDTQGEMVFRPDTHPLGPSRGRAGYRFKADGRVERSGPGPTDRTASNEGAWTLDANGHVNIRMPDGSEETLKISALKADRLVIKK